MPRIRLRSKSHFQRRISEMKLASNMGMLLLGIWLVLTGALPLLQISFQGKDPLMCALAIAAGVLILMNK
jgi:hypothetical protein